MIYLKGEILEFRDIKIIGLSNEDTVRLKEAYEKISAKIDFKKLRKLSLKKQVDGFIEQYKKGSWQIS